MWKNIIASYLSIRETVFAYVQTLVEIFGKTLEDIIATVDEDFLDLIDFVVPDTILGLTLLELMTGVFVPVLLVLFIVRLFL